jgi:hypothetical protein
MAAKGRNKSTQSTPAFHADIIFKVSRIPPAMVKGIVLRPIVLPEELLVLVEAWNESFPPYLEMSPHRLDAYLSLDPNHDPDGCIGAFTEDGALAGFGIGKCWIIPNHDMAIQHE